MSCLPPKSSLKTTYSAVHLNIPLDPFGPLKYQHFQESNPHDHSSSSSSSSSSLLLRFWKALKVSWSVPPFSFTSPSDASNAERRVFSAKTSNFSVASCTQPSAFSTTAVLRSWGVRVFAVQVFDKYSIGILLPKFRRICIYFEASTFWTLTPSSNRRENYIMQVRMLHYRTIYTKLEKQSPVPILKRSIPPLPENTLALFFLVAKSIHFRKRPRLTSSSNSFSISSYCSSLCVFLAVRCITTLVNCATFRSSCGRSVASEISGPVSAGASGSDGGESPMATGWP